MNISIIGTGYVGLVSGACLAEVGHKVICVDNNKQKIAAISDGQSPIHEAGLNQILSRQIGSSLTGSTDLTSAVEQTDITIIAVGTPFDGRRIDLSFVETVTSQIGRALRGKDDFHIVVVKSTLVPGTTDGVVKDILENTSGKIVSVDIGLSMNPEFLTEGTAVSDFMKPDRIVIGSSDNRTREVMKQVYAPFREAEVLYTNNKTAEMIKYASNSVLATMISFSNEIAALCSAIGDIDVVDVMKGVHAAAYFTTRADNAEPVQAGITSFLGAGCGFGGSCLPKDVSALAAQGEELGLPMNMLNSVMSINGAQPGRVYSLIKKHLESLSGIRVAILGLAFKPETDDVRKSPAFPIIELLRGEGALIIAYDPIATENAQRVLGDDSIHYVNSMEDAVRDADVVVLVTAWPEFLNLPNIVSGERQPIIVDGRRILKKGDYSRYEGIGL